MLKIILKIIFHRIKNLGIVIIVIVSIVIGIVIAAAAYVAVKLYVLDKKTTNSSTTNNSNSTIPVSRMTTTRVLTTRNTTPTTTSMSLRKNYHRQCPCNLDGLWVDIVFVIESSTAVGRQRFTEVGIDRVLKSI